MELEPEKEEGEDDEDDEDDMGEPEDVIIVPIYRKVVPNIQKFWLRMKPD